MRNRERVFLALVLGCAALFAARTFSAIAERVTPGEEEAPAGTPSAGQPRDVDLERLRRMLERGLLSDREALHYRKLPDDGSESR